ncbi:MAG TPA: hypothetical protein VIF38_03170 [Burkholderiales bacterium]|jgi:hypothetical protein
MAVHREQRGQYLIEASAFHLPDNMWQPRLTMTRMPQGKELARTQGFPGLSPAFETAKAAIGFAADLGRSLADSRSSRLTV